MGFKSIDGSPHNSFALTSWVASLHWDSFSEDVGNLSTLGPKLVPLNLLSQETQRAAQVTPSSTALLDSSGPHEERASEMCRWCGSQCLQRPRALGGSQQERTSSFPWVPLDSALNASLLPLKLPVVEINQHRSDQGSLCHLHLSSYLCSWNLLACWPWLSFICHPMPRRAKDLKCHWWLWNFLISGMRKNCSHFPSQLYVLLKSSLEAKW